MTIFTLAPKGHPTDPRVLEHGYKLWSTFALSIDLTRYFVRSNKPDTAGGQSWLVIAEYNGILWRVESGNGMLSQGGSLLARYLISQGANVRSVARPFAGKVKRYDATAKVYSLPSILNNMTAVVSRDKLADERSKARKTSLSALMAAREARLTKGGV